MIKASVQLFAGTGPEMDYFEFNVDFPYLPSVGDRAWFDIRYGDSDDDWGSFVCKCTQRTFLMDQKEEGDDTPDVLLIFELEDDDDDSDLDEYLRCKKRSAGRTAAQAEGK